MTKTTPDFSVVIPTYNRADLMKVCLDSLVQQTFKNFEVIICDNGSTDHTKDVVDLYLNKLDIQYYMLEPSGGPGRPRNIGIQKASADWVCLLDSDDWWAPNKLEVIRSRLQDSDFIYHSVYVSDGISYGRKIGSKLKTNDWREFIYLGNPIACSSVAFRGSFIQKIGLHDESPELKYILDFEYWIRFLKCSSRVCFIDIPLAYYYVSPGNNLSGNEIKNFESHQYLYRKYENEIHDLQIQNKIKASLNYRQIRAYVKTHTSEFMPTDILFTILYLEGLKLKINYIIYLIRFKFKIF